MTDHAENVQGGPPPMARETKVGLLAGLAFIICFAIILTNRGREEAAVPPRPILSDSGGRVPENLQRNASRGPARTTPALPTSGSELALADRSGSGGAASIPSPIASPPPAFSAPDSAAVGLGETAERILTSRTGEPSASPLLPQKSIVPVSGIATASDTGSASKATGAPYTVVSGDTLSKIALSHYGNKSKAAVESIFEANRAVLPNPNDLKTGLVLTLPNLPPPKQPVAAPTSPNSAAGEPKISSTVLANDAPNSSYRFYQVKKNDRWVSIARDQLGDAGRWKELHELNKDKFPDPQKIREGVRVRLPATKALGTLEGRR